MSWRRIRTQFDRIYQTARLRENLPSEDLHHHHRVIFSDHHKGDLSSADDFKKNADLYATALDFYAKKNYRLIVLGDSEELWENRFSHVWENYDHIIKREVSLAPRSQQGRPLRILGNHDKELSFPRFRSSYREFDHPPLKQVDFREGLCLDKDIFLVHGHQGRFLDDQAWRLSRWAVQIFWRTIQRLFHIGMDGPAENAKIRDVLEINYYRWAKINRILLICGHTHRAVFASRTHFDQLQEDLAAARRRLLTAEPKERPKLSARILEVESEIEEILLRRGGRPFRTFEKDRADSLPCYFNSGCCGYTNGITCIEITEDRIQLVKWQRDNRSRTILSAADLSALREQIHSGDLKGSRQDSPRPSEGKEGPRGKKRRVGEEAPSSPFSKP